MLDGMPRPADPKHRLEFYSPAYLSKPRPSYKGLPATVNYNSKFTLSVQLPPDTTGVTGTPLVLHAENHWY